MKKTALLFTTCIAASVSYAQVFDTGTDVGIGNPAPLYKLDVDGDINMTSGNVLRIGGSQVFSTSGLKNMFLGDGTGTNLTTGSYNAAIGFKAGENINTGQFNTVIGFKAGQNMTSANSNTIIGKDAGRDNSGNQNVLIGREAGKSNAGAENTFIGDKVGLTNVGGTSNTLIGKSADVAGDSLTNATAIGAGAIAGASNTVILGSGASVGIGISTPQNDLHIHDTNFSFASFTQSSSGTTATDGLLIGSQGGNTFVWNYEATDLTFGTDNLSRMTVASGGNVGIGTTSPTAALHVNGDAKIGYGDAYMMGAYDALWYNSGSPIGNVIGSSNPSHNLTVSVGGSDAHIFASTGNVGIGTTSPVQKLHVNGDTHVSGDIGVGDQTAPSFAIDALKTSGSCFGKFKSDNGYAGLIIDKGSASDNGYLQYRTGGAGKWYVGTIGNDKYSISRSFSGTGDGTFVIDNAGNIGIGTTSPVNLLDVEGDAASTAYPVDVRVNYVGTSDVRAINAVSTPADGYGYGVRAEGGYRGVYGKGNGGAYTGTSIGVYGIASGSAGTRTGIYGSASGGTTNWAGYFSGGNVYVGNDMRIGTTVGATGYKVSVNGKVICEELKVQDSGSWPDYVFAPEYNLPSLEEVEAHIDANNHLPGVPSAATVEAEGISVGEMTKTLMEKVEELTLYMIDADKRIKALEKENILLKSTK